MIRGRNILLKDCVLNKYQVERSNNKMLKYSFFRKWKNKKIKANVESLNVFRKNDYIKTILLFKTVEKLIKNNILKIFKKKTLKFKKIKESKKIDFYINLNQVKYNFKRQKLAWN